MNKNSMRFLSSVLTAIVFSCSTSLWASFEKDNEELNISPRHFATNFISSNKSEEITANTNKTLKLDKEKDLKYREFNSLADFEIYKTERQPQKLLQGDDRRTPLFEKVQEGLNRSHFFLEIIYENFRKSAKTRVYYGSGTLIKENLLLTAGHNLYDEVDGGYPTRIDCYGFCKSFKTNNFI